MKKSTKAPEKKQDCCPNCGYCPHCGHAPYRAVPIYPLPYPWYVPVTYIGTPTLPYQSNVIDTNPSWTITCSTPTSNGAGCYTLTGGTA